MFAFIYKAAFDTIYPCRDAGLGIAASKLVEIEDPNDVDKADELDDVVYTAS